MATKKNLDHFLALWKSALKASRYQRIFRLNLPGRVPSLSPLTKQPSRKRRIATELTLTAAATVGGWWRSGGVEEEEVMNSPSGTKWIIQLYSTKTPTGAGIVYTIPSAVNNMTNSITPWNGEHTPTPLWFLLLICTIPCLRGIIHHLLFRLSFLRFHVCLEHHLLSLE